MAVYIFTIVYLYIPRFNQHPTDIYIYRLSTIKYRFKSHQISIFHHFALCTTPGGGRDEPLVEHRKDGSRGGPEPLEAETAEEIHCWRLQRISLMNWKRLETIMIGSWYEFP